MRFEQLALWLAGLDPWWMISLGISLVILDLLITSSQYLTTVAMALAMMGFSNMLGLPATLQLWLTPVLFLVSYIFTEKLYSKFSTREAPYQHGIESRIGQNGYVIIHEVKNDTDNFFYGYKRKIDIENHGNHLPEIKRTYKIKFEDGEVLPIKEFDGHLSHGNKVKVVEILNGAAVISKDI